MFQIKCHNIFGMNASLTYGLQLEMKTDSVWLFVCLFVLYVLVFVIFLNPEGALKAKHYIFVEVGGAVFFLFFFFFQPTGRLAFVKIYNFLQVVVFLKNAVLWVSLVQMGSFGANTLYYIPVKPG